MRRRGYGRRRQAGRGAPVDLSCAVRISLAACVVALVVHAAGCASSPPMRAMLPREGIDVPVEMWAGVPTVQVTVNGRGPYRFVVDTGSTPAAGFSTALARELGLPAESGSTV